MAGLNSTSAATTDFSAFIPDFSSFASYQLPVSISPFLLSLSEKITGLNILSPSGAMATCWSLTSLGSDLRDAGDVELSKLIKADSAIQAEGLTFRDKFAITAHLLPVATKVVSYLGNFELGWFGTLAPYALSLATNFFEVSDLSREASAVRKRLDNNHHYEEEQIKAAGFFRTLLKYEVPTSPKAGDFKPELKATVQKLVELGHLRNVAEARTAGLKAMRNRADERAVDNRDLARIWQELLSNFHHTASLKFMPQEDFGPAGQVRWNSPIPQASGHDVDATLSGQDMLSEDDFQPAATSSILRHPRGRQVHFGSTPSVSSSPAPDLSISQLMDLADSKLLDKTQPTPHTQQARGDLPRLLGEEAPTVKFSYAQLSEEAQSAADSLTEIRRVRNMELSKNPENPALEGAIRSNPLLSVTSDYVKGVVIELFHPAEQEAEVAENLEADAPENREPAAQVNTDTGDVRPGLDGEEIGEGVAPLDPELKKQKIIEATKTFMPDFNLDAQDLNELNSGFFFRLYEALTENDLGFNDFDLLNHLRQELPTETADLAEVHADDFGNVHNFKEALLMILDQEFCGFEVERYSRLALDERVSSTSHAIDYLLSRTQGTLELSDQWHKEILSSELYTEALALKEDALKELQKKESEKYVKSHLSKVEIQDPTHTPFTKENVYQGIFEFVDLSLLGWQLNSLYEQQKRDNYRKQLLEFASPSKD